MCTTQEQAVADGPLATNMASPSPAGRTIKKIGSNMSIRTSTAGAGFVGSEGERAGHGGRTMQGTDPPVNDPIFPHTRKGTGPHSHKIIQRHQRKCQCRPPSPSPPTKCSTVTRTTLRATRPFLHSTHIPHHIPTPTSIPTTHTHTRTPPKPHPRVTHALPAIHTPTPTLTHSHTPTHARMRKTLATANPPNTHPHRNHIRSSASASTRTTTGTASQRGSGSVQRAQPGVRTPRTRTQTQTQTGTAARRILSRKRATRRPLPRTATRSRAGSSHRATVATNSTGAIPVPTARAGVSVVAGARAGARMVPVPVPVGHMLGIDMTRMTCVADGSKDFLVICRGGKCTSVSELRCSTLRGPCFLGLVHIVNRELECTWI
ncbi:hypothetical protein BC827DRAFT_608257 [Russula dissimulans]|nr:hypothetical protein BC827DRAFT_608257 [Russula dissimulans]